MTDATVAGLGEDGILTVLHRRFTTVPAAGDWPEGTLGPGDDAAVVPAPDGRFVISTDAMAQDRDFRLRWPSGAVDSGYSTGWKAAAQNLSDINAMGAETSSLLLALTMPESTPVAWLDRFAAGIAGAVRHLGATSCRIAGGDLGGDDRVTVCVTVTGDLHGREPVLRTLPSGQSVPQQPLDLVLCGRVGWAAAGLTVLQTPRDTLLSIVETTQTARVAARAAAAQLRPRPVLTAGRIAADHGALAMMDVSDGLERDAGRLATANGLHAELDDDWVQQAAEELRPLAAALGADAERWVRSGGEDYGLLAAVPAGAVPPTGFVRVGRLIPSSRSTQAPAPSTGWDHFGG